MLSARDHRRKEDIIETSLCNKGLTTDSPHLRDFLRYLPNLTALDLSFNAMVAIPNLSCGGASIRALNLSNNNICDNTLFSPISLARLSHIIELRMAFNHVTTLAGFKVAVNLQYLDLSHNKIHSLFGIENLKELKCVRLGYNHIDRGLRLFSLMKKLVDIDISHNPVSAKGKLYSAAIRTYVPTLMYLDGNYLGRSKKAISAHSNNRGKYDSTHEHNTHSCNSSDATSKNNHSNSPRLASTLEDSSHFTDGYNEEDRQAQAIMNSPPLPSELQSVGNAWSPGYSRMHDIRQKEEEDIRNKHQRVRVNTLKQKDAQIRNSSVSTRGNNKVKSTSVEKRKGNITSNQDMSRSHRVAKSASTSPTKDRSDPTSGSPGFNNSKYIEFPLDTDKVASLRRYGKINVTEAMHRSEGVTKMSGGEKNSHNGGSMLHPRKDRLNVYPLRVKPLDTPYSIVNMSIDSSKDDIYSTSAGGSNTRRVVMTGAYSGTSTDDHKYQPHKSKRGSVIDGSRARVHAFDDSASSIYNNNGDGSLIYLFEDSEFSTLHGQMNQANKKSNVSSIQSSSSNHKREISKTKEDGAIPIAIAAPEVTGTRATLAYYDELDRYHMDTNHETYMSAHQASHLPWRRPPEPLPRQFRGQDVTLIDYDQLNHQTSGSEFRHRTRVTLEAIKEERRAALDVLEKERHKPKWLSPNLSLTSSPRSPQSRVHTNPLVEYDHQSQFLDMTQSKHDNDNNDDGSNDHVPYSNMATRSKQARSNHNNDGDGHNESTVTINNTTTLRVLGDSHHPNHHLHIYAYPRKSSPPRGTLQKNELEDKSPEMEYNDSNEDSSAEEGYGAAYNRTLQREKHQGDYGNYEFQHQGYDSYDANSIDDEDEAKNGDDGYAEDDGEKKTTAALSPAHPRQTRASMQRLLKATQLRQQALQQQEEEELQKERRRHHNEKLLRRRDNRGGTDNPSSPRNLPTSSKTKTDVYTGIDMAPLPAEVSLSHAWEPQLSDEPEAVLSFSQKGQREAPTRAGREGNANFTMNEAIVRGQYAAYYSPPGASVPSGPQRDKRDGNTSQRRGTFFGLYKKDKKDTVKETSSSAVTQQDMHTYHQELQLEAEEDEDEEDEDDNDDKDEEENGYDDSDGEGVRLGDALNSVASDGLSSASQGSYSIQDYLAHAEDFLLESGDTNLFSAADLIRDGPHCNTTNNNNGSDDEKDEDDDDEEEEEVVQAPHTADLVTKSTHSSYTSYANTGGKNHINNNIESNHTSHSSLHDNILLEVSEALDRSEAYLMESSLASSNSSTGNSHYSFSQMPSPMNQRTHMRDNEERDTPPLLPSELDQVLGYVRETEIDATSGDIDNDNNNNNNGGGGGDGDVREEDTDLLTHEAKTRSMSSERAATDDVDSQLFSDVSFADVPLRKDTYLGHPLHRHNPLEYELGQLKRQHNSLKDQLQEEKKALMAMKPMEAVNSNVTTATEEVTLAESTPSTSISHADITNDHKRTKGRVVNGKPASLGDGAIDPKKRKNSKSAIQLAYEHIRDNDDVSQEDKERVKQMLMQEVALRMKEKQSQRILALPSESLDPVNHDGNQQGKHIESQLLNHNLVDHSLPSRIISRHGGDNGHDVVDSGTNTIVDDDTTIGDDEGGNVHFYEDHTSSDESHHKARRERNNVQKSTTTTTTTTTTTSSSNGASTTTTESTVPATHSRPGVKLNDDGNTKMISFTNIGETENSSTPFHQKALEELKKQQQRNKSNKSKKKGRKY